MNPAGLTTPNPYREVKYECGHIAWFLPVLTPKPGDSVFCTKCDDYTNVFPSFASMGTMYMDTWKSEPRKNGFVGVCTYRGEDGEDDECGEPFKHRNWHSLETLLHVHYMRTHTRFGATLIITTVDRLPPNSPPPF